MLFTTLVIAVVLVLAGMVAYLLCAFVWGFVIEFRRLQRPDYERRLDDYERDEY